MTLAGGVPAAGDEFTIPAIGTDSTVTAAVPEPMLPTSESSDDSQRRSGSARELHLYESAALASPDASVGTRQVEDSLLETSLLFLSLVQTLQWGQELMNRSFSTSKLARTGDN